MRFPPVRWLSFISKFALAVVLALAFVAFDISELSAHMIPFGFWKNSTPVCIFTVNTVVTSANVASLSNCVWEIRDGVTVTTNYASAIPILGLTLTSTSKLTHLGCSSTVCTPLNLAVTGNVTLVSGALITASGLGYLGGYQVGPDAVTNNVATGQTDAFAAGAGATAGGSHGGWGGWNSASASNLPSLPFGALKDPVTYGSGGGGSSASNKGGNGGGVIKLAISGTLTLNGNGTTPVISADGADGSCGGGAGGSINISAQNISSNTSGILFRASGGAGGNTSTCSANAGGGGGGHIAISYTQSLLGTMAISSTFVRAYGGTQTNSTAAYYGGSGTIAVTSTSSASGDLYVYGPNNSSYLYNGTPIGGFGWVTSVASGSVGFTSYTSQVAAGQFTGTLIPDADALTLSPQTISTTAATTISTSTGDLTTLTAVGKLWAVNDSRYNTFSNVYISDAAKVAAGYLYSGGMLSVSNTSKLTAANLIATTLNINDTAVLTHFASDLNYVGRLKITSSTVTVASGAAINADALGYLGGKRAALRGSNSSQFGMTFGLTTTGGSDLGAGGSHGGFGGFDLNNPNYIYYPSVSYGSVSAPVDPGSGGGTAGTVASQAGGNGGGVIIINASSSLTVNGLISALGETNLAQEGGTGAGGSIYVTTATLTSASVGLSFNASGGDQGPSAESGGGGRISLTYTTLGGTMAITSTKIKANGGVGVDIPYEGNAGTVYAFQNGVSTSGNLYFLDSKFSFFRGAMLSPYGYVTSVSSIMIRDSNLSSNARDFTFTKAQIVGKKLVANANLATPTEFDITDYNPATGVINVTPDPSAIPTGSFFYIKGFNTDYDNVYLNSSTRVQTPYLSISQSLYAAPGSVFVLDIVRLIATTINFVDGGTYLRPWASTGTKAPLPLIISGTNMNVGANTSVNASGAGYVGGNTSMVIGRGREGIATNTNNKGYYNGNVITGGSALYSGGSASGYGGIYSTSTPGTPYMDMLQPFAFGSGSGGNPAATAGTALGQPGGGAIKIDMTGTLTVDGYISAGGFGDQHNLTGSSTAGDINAAAGGGGGSIWITTNTITSSTAGADHVVATGGNVSNVSGTSACGGGGGNIAIYYTTMSGTFGTSKVATQGGTGKSGCQGGTGLKYYKKSSDSYGSLETWNPSASNYSQTPLPAYNTTFLTVGIFGSSRVKQFSSANSITIMTSLYVDGGANLYVPNDQSSVTPYNNVTPVGTWFNIAPAKVSGTITEY